MSHPSLSTVVEVRITRSDRHPEEVVHVGDGSADHFLAAFRVALVAAGWTVEEASALGWIGVAD